MILSGVPWFITTSLINVYIRALALLTSLNGISRANFISLSLITKILSYTVPVRGSFDNSSLIIKSIAINDYTLSGITGD